MAGAGAAGEADAARLAPLCEEAFLRNLHVRFQRDIVYTYVGAAVVSVNPCRALPLYSAELVRAYLSRPPHLLPPHVYAVAAAAYCCVRDRRESQCVVITGESGAGKTEAARVCLQCAVLAGGGGGAGAALAAAGTLLEAFGNAATARNHNASRFGKLVEVELDERGATLAGLVTPYMLEKGRVCGVPAGERNFHVLYQLLAGADPPLLKRLKLQRSWEQYRVLRAAPGAGGGSPRRAPAAPREPQDAQHFQYTKSAAEAVGVGGARWAGVLRVLAFALKLGNVACEPRASLAGALLAAPRRHTRHELLDACALVGVPPHALAAALGLHAEGWGEGSEAEEEEEGASESESECDAGGEEEAGCAGWAAARRDRLVGALYARLFAWLVAQVNARLQAGGGAGAGASGGGGGGGARCSLGILDMYGLESLAHNGLERLAINYAAERVHACAAQALRRRREQALLDGLPAPAPAPAAAAADHAEVADLLDQGAASVLGAVRECGLARAPDAALLALLARRRHPRLLVLPPQHFTVVHFGGAVRYSARGMVRAERDAPPARAAQVLARAAEPLLRALFAPAPAPSAAPVGLAGRQRALVRALVARVHECAGGARLVRCLRADASLRARRFDKALVRHQLRTQGLVEMALEARAGWCEALGARALLSRYGVLGPGGRAPAPADDAGAVRAARALVRALPLPAAEFSFGRSTVFVRSPRTVWELERWRQVRVRALVRVAQRAWRAHRARAQRRRAADTIARAWLRHRAGAGARLSRSRASGAGAVAWRAWALSARRRHLLAVARWLAAAGARARSPLAPLWPAPAHPALLSRADALLRHLHHAWRCRLYRQAFGQHARNRMREKVTASALFLGRKALYAGSVARPFLGDYAGLRGAARWARGGGAGADRFLVFADAARKVSLRGRAGADGQPRAARCVAALSTRALLLLDARSLRPRRRVPAHHVAGLHLSPYADDLLLVHVHPYWCGAEGGSSSAGESGSGGEGAAGCLAGGAGGAGGGRGDVLLRTAHALELATKLFLVVQNACAAPPHVNIDTQLEADAGGRGRGVRIVFHGGEQAGGGGVGGGGGGGGECAGGGAWTRAGGGGAGARLVLRRGALHVLL